MSTPFRYFLRVRYGECDAQHVVYNAKYGEYIDLAATEFMRTAFAPESVFGGSFEFQVVKLLVEWKAPARLDEVLEISVRPTRFGTTSFTLGFELRVAGHPDVIVTGETVNVHATRDGTHWTKAAIPAATRTKLETVPLGRSINHAGAIPTG
jgi:acyl-CoA thioester hydrolase